jgi:integrase
LFQDIIGVPMHPLLQDELPRYIRENNIKDKLFSLPSHKISAGWAEVCRTLVIRDLRFHDLRH